MQAELGDDSVALYLQQERLAAVRENQWVRFGEFVPAVRFQELGEAAGMGKYVRNSEAAALMSRTGHTVSSSGQKQSKVKAGFINHL